jgi:hypothetical protein
MVNPGGLSSFIGAFFTQFFINFYPGTLILVAACIFIYFLSDYIFRKHGIKGILFPMIPVLLFLSLQSDYRYSFGNTTGFILALSFSAFYFSNNKPWARYLVGFAGWILLYFATGGFSLIAAVLCAIHELFHIRSRYRFALASGYVLMAILIPYLAWDFIYYLPLSKAWFMQILFPFPGISKYLLFLLVVFCPLTLLALDIWKQLAHKEIVNFHWDAKTIILGSVMFLFGSWIVIRSYDAKSEALFRIDYYVQHAKWEKALNQSARYPGINRLIIYFTNLSLYESGQMGDLLFHYKHTGKDDLWLEWPGGKLSLFFGADIFYYLGYFNETYRRAFDGMILNGQNPRALKFLAKISLINGRNELALKHLNVLSQTLFYRKWAQPYKAMLKDPDLRQKDPEIIQKRKLLLNSDFLIDANNTDQLLFQLMKFQPDNRMAYEYFMSALLLDKNITSFTGYTYLLRHYGFKEIPVCYEEAMLVIMNQTQKNIVPEGYSIRNTTIQRFNNYFSDYSNALSAFSGNPELMSKKLNEKYGATYWYYLHFLNGNLKIR